MSEEILKALMQLFAIIAKQDNGATTAHKLFVESFLKFQLASDKVGEYLTLYDNHLDDGEAKNNIVSDERKESKLTSVKDSVRTLGICKKINKTLSQKQKVVVLVRLLEMLKKENQFTDQRLGIIDTVATVFNIVKEDLELIRHLIIQDDPYLLTSENLLIIDSKELSEEKQKESTHHIESEGLNGSISIINAKSVDLYFSKYTGNNKLTVNGLSFTPNSIFLLAPGSNIRLPQGTIYYSDILSKFLSNKQQGSLTFTANHIQFKFPNGKIGLQNIFVSEKLGKLIAIMGASGAGKTTLLNVLCGLEKPSSGDITINGISLVNEPDKLEGIIGYISQDDLLIEELTVYENLYFSARLCFAQLNDNEIKMRVESTLTDLGLIGVKDIKVGSPLDKKISGGQRKRLNIALELIREPTVLFVDEPTSGLSSADSENVMDILKELSIKGKLIFVVIHQPSSDIYKMFDKLILMDVGGYQVYYGNPIDAITYLKKQTQQANAEAGECHVCGNVNPELLFSLLEAKVVNEYGQFQNERKIKPTGWNELFIKNIKQTLIDDGNKIPEKIFNIPDTIRQWKIFTLRDVKSKIANTQYLIINALEAPLLALLLAFVIKFSVNHEKERYLFKNNDNIPAYLFVCVIVSLFIGLTVSAEEIFRDKKILKREKFLNLSKLSYLFSKIAILFVLSAIQSALFVLIGNYILEIKEMFFSYWLMLFSVSCFANILGLNISATFNSAVTIYILIPILVIPQLIFGGAMFSFDKINYLLGGGKPLTPIVADVFVSRWAYEGLVVNQFANNYYEKPFFEIDRKLSFINFKQAYLLPQIKDDIGTAKKMLSSTSKNDSLKNALNHKVTIIKNTLIDEYTVLNKRNNLLKKSTVVDSLYLLELKKVVNEIETFYITQYDKALIKKEQIEKKVISSKKDYNIQTQQDLYTNDCLTDLVKKTTEKNKTLLYNNKFIQNMDPVFTKPKPDNILDYRSSFFSATKHFLNKYYPTYLFNVSVIWIMSFILFITLYTDAFLKISNRLLSIFKKR